MLSAILAVIVATAVTGDARKSHLIYDGEPRSDYVVDPSWTPSPSDRATLFRPTEGPIVAALAYLDLIDMAKAILADDEHGLAEIFRNGRAVVIPCHTPVLVLERHLQPIVASRSNVLEVRVLAGTYESRSFYVLEEFVEKLILRPLVADGSYRHKLGDTVSTIYEETPLAEVRADLDDFEKARHEGDRAAMEAMVKDGKVALMGRFFALQVVNIQAVDVGIARSKKKDIAGKTEDAAAFTAAHPAGYVVELKAPSGKTLYASRRNVGRLVNGPVATKPEPSLLSLDRVKPPNRKAADPAVRAKADLDRADLLVEQGKSDEALRAFRAIVKAFPGTPPAEAATARIKAITGQVKASRPKK